MYNRTVYRVQDKEGRGPFKPGFSHCWLDQNRTLESHPSIMQDFGWDFTRLIHPGEHFGCCFLSMDALLRWFSVSELERLERYKHHAIELRDCRIIAESSTQVMMSRIKPLRVGAVRVKWRQLIAA